MNNTQKVTLRPNLNTGKRCKETGVYLTTPYTTIHSERLGAKEDSVLTATIRCVDTVVRPSGQQKAEKDGEKTVHAGVIGYLVPTIKADPKIHPRVNYAPHRGDKFFHIDGVKYSGGGYITAVGHYYYLVG